jgi:outer membrane protein assembly factor BamD
MRIFDNKRLFWGLLAVVIMLTGCKMWLPWGKSANMSRTTPEGLYQQGVELYQKKDYTEAIKLFQRVKEEHPLSTLAIMAELGIADAYYSDKEYADANLAYSEFINLHPTNENLPYAMYQIGMCHFSDISSIDRDQSETIKALKAFERLMARFPDSKFFAMAEKMARDCKKRLGEQEFYIGKFYFNMKEYGAALERFEKIDKDYTKVGLDEKVHQFIAEAKKRIAEADAKKTRLKNSAR